MTKIYYQQMGEGPNCVLLHGWGFNSDIWQELALSLSPYFRVTLLDIPGFGRSQQVNLSDYNLDTLTSEILKICADQAIYIGWSLGGLIAMYLSIYHPTRVMKLITIASTPHFVENNQWPGMPFSALEKFTQQLKTNFEATINDFIDLQFYQIKINATQLKKIKQSILQYGPPTDQALFGGLEILKTNDLRHALTEIKQPFLAIFGRNDKIVSSSVPAALSQFKPDIQTIIIPKAGHAVFLTHGDEVSGIIKRALSVV